VKFKYLFIILILLAIIFCNSNTQNTASDNAKSTETSSSKKVINIENGITHGIADTMYLNGIDGLMVAPDTRSNEIVRLERCTVFVINKIALPNVETHNGVDSFVKVRTINNDTGYLWRKVLITLSQLNAHNDSLALWAKQPMPLYENLVGKTYFKDSDLAPELSSGGFISCGENNLYGIISFHNKYNGDYSYLFFVIEDKREGNGLKVLDIVPLNPGDFKNDATLWHNQCTCQDQTKDCADVIAIYLHNEDMAKQGIMVKPDKAWQPNYKTQKLELIPPETVDCGSTAPEFTEDDVGP
jgi:hypothetical protein